MPNISSVFASAAKLVEKTPWTWRVAAGGLAGVTEQILMGDPNANMEDKIGKGLLIGGIVGAASGSFIRGAGKASEGLFNKSTGYLGKRMGVYSSEIANKAGVLPSMQKAFMTPAIMAVTGAGIGAAVAGPDRRIKGALIGGGLGLASIPTMNLFKAHSALGKIPGGQTALYATAGLGITAYGAFADNDHHSEINGQMEEGGMMSYSPSSSSVSDRMSAMNASGSIVLGSHSLRHR